MCAMGIVSDEDFLTEQERLVSVPLSVEIRDINIGRGNGSTKVPNEVRSIIGEVGVVSREGAISLANSLGISPSSASAYKVGATSTTSYNSPSKSLGNHIDKVKGRIIKRAKNRLLDALDSITTEKLEAADLKEASSVARDMSVIVKNMEEDSSSKQNGNNIQNNFVLFRPMMKSEDSFETIYAKE